MVGAEEKIKAMGLKLPEPPKPVAAYVPAVRVEDYVYTAGQIAFVNGELQYPGKVGCEVSVEDAYEAAKICVLNCLAVIKDLIGDLDCVEKVVKVTGYVSSAAGFEKQPQVLNGASQLLGNIFGEAGQHARVAVGVSELPANAAVEVEMIVKVKQN